MALDARKRQKKVERKRAKQRAKRKQIVRHDPHDITAQFERAGSAPVLHSLATATLWDQGMGNVLLSRSLPMRQVAFGCFLVDMYCLGVKDAFFGIMPCSEYEERALDPLEVRNDMIELTPEATRKLVEGAVEYARDLGFPPHPDYRVARLIFGNIDAGECAETFEYGKDGKPCFINGPSDSFERCREITSILRNRCGDDGYESLFIG
jgi:hypothetical protein